MKVYNKSLDYTLLALAACVNGDPVTAGKLLVKASRQPDVKRAVAVLEASNAQAFNVEQAKVQAAAKAKKAAKPAEVKAAKRVAAATQVKAFDMGDESEINELIDSGDIGDDVDEAEVVEEAAVEEGEDEDDFDATFASVLKGMDGKKR